MNPIVKVVVLLSFVMVIAPAGAAPEGSISRTGPDTMQRAPTATLAVDPQIAALQQQVRALQEQVALLQSVLQVTPAGTTLRAPAVSIISTGGTLIESARETVIRTGSDMALQSSAGLTIKAGSAAQVEGAGSLSLKGATIRLNGGTRPVAIVGSAVGNGAIASGSATIMAE